METKSVAQGSEYQSSAEKHRAKYEASLALAREIIKTHLCGLPLNEAKDALKYAAGILADFSVVRYADPVEDPDQ